MVKQLRDSIDSSALAEPQLLLTHITRSCNLSKILEKGYLETTDCKVFKSNLLYFYYGRAEYREFADSVTANSNLKPICIILKGIQNDEIETTFPFDSGAFDRNGGLKDIFFQHIHNVEELSIGKDVFSAQKLVKCFYENNDNYINFYPVHRQSDPFEEPDVECYNRLVLGHSKGELDGRSSTIEIISNKNIPTSNIIAIIAPNDFKNSHSLKNKLDTLGIELQFYFSRSPQMVDNFSSVIQHCFNQFQDAHVQAN